MDKNKQINIRVSKEELDQLKRRSSNYKNLSSYILDACMQFDDTLTINRINLINSWSSEFVKYKSDLAHLGSNINQLAHYVNSQIQMGIFTNTAVRKEIDLLESVRLLLLQIEEQNNFIISEFKNVIRKK